MARFLNLNPLSSSELNLHVKVKTASNRRYVNKHQGKMIRSAIDHSENIASPAGVSRGTRISSPPPPPPPPPQGNNSLRTADVFPVVASLPPKNKEATTRNTSAVCR